MNDRSFCPCCGKMLTVRTWPPLLATRKTHFGKILCTNDKCDLKWSTRVLKGDSEADVRRKLLEANKKPLLKPLTLQEAREIAPDRPVYREDKGSGVFINTWGETAQNTLQGYYNEIEYGHTFRYWPDRKPTDEEVEAAEWKK